MASQQGVWTRKFLKDKGYKDNQIKYDPKTQTVSAGNDFKVHASSIDPNSGKAFASLTSLQHAYQNRKPSKPTVSDYRKNLVDSLYEKSQQKAEPFSYNPRTDPAYQSQLALARDNIRTDQANTNAFLRARGQGNSSYSQTLMNQQAAKQENRLSNTIVPELTRQAYNRYLNQQAQQQQQFNNQLGLAGYLGDQQQREFNNGLQTAQLTGNYNGTPTLAAQGQQFNQNLQTQQFNANQEQRGLDNAFRNNQFDYAKQQDSLDNAFRQNQANIQNQLRQQEFEREGQQFAQRMGLDWAQLNQQQKEFVADQAYRNNQLGLEQQRINIQQQQASQQGAEDMNSEKQGLVSALRGGQMTPAQALEQISQDTDLGFYTPQQAKVLQDVVNYFASNPAAPDQPLQPATSEQQSMIPSNSELDKIYQQEGSQYPSVDWKSWYVSPQGRLGGVDFETWNKTYGPRLVFPQ